jgi:hypothetical protein
MILAHLTTLVSDACTTFIALTFAQSAWHKLSEFDSFTGFVADYQLIPERIVTGVSKSLVAMEAGILIGLAMDDTRTAAAALAVAAFLIYAGAMTLNILRGRSHIDCGCGRATQPLHWTLVVRSVALAGVACLTLLPNSSAASWVEGAIAIAAGLSLWLSLVLTGQVLANSARLRLLRLEDV